MTRISTVPNAIQSSIEKILKSYPEKVLKADFLTISQRINQQFTYLPLDHKKPKKETGKVNDVEKVNEKIQKSILYAYGQRETAVYLATQFPFNFGFLSSVLREIKMRNESFFPSSILDFGAGPATAYFSCLETWDSARIQQDTRYVGIDISADMLEAAQQMLHEIDSNHNVILKQYLPIHTGSVQERYDLVICNFSLLETYRDPSTFQTTLRNLWASTGSYFIVVNRADRESYELTQQVKKFIVENDGYIYAPCCNDIVDAENQCPCIFAHKIGVTELQRRIMNLKIRESPLKYTFLIGCKGARPDDSRESVRIVGPPSKLKNYIEFNLCTKTKGGLIEGYVTKKDSVEVYKKARKAKWGDMWDFPYHIVTGK